MTDKALVLDERAEVDWVDFEHSLHDHFDLNAVTLKKDGHRQTEQDIIWANKLCALITTNPEGANRICDPMKRYLIHKAGTNRRCAADECAAGMYRIIVPIIRNNDIEGFVSVCGRPFSNTDRIYIDYIHRTIDENEEKIEELLSSLNPILPRTIKKLKLFITSYVQ